MIIALLQMEWSTIVRFSVIYATVALIVIGVISLFIKALIEDDEVMLILQFVSFVIIFFFLWRFHYFGGKDLTYRPAPVVDEAGESVSAKDTEGNPPSTPKVFVPSDDLEEIFHNIDDALSWQEE